MARLERMKTEGTIGEAAYAAAEKHGLTPEQAVQVNQFLSTASTVTPGDQLETLERLWNLRRTNAIDDTLYNAIGNAMGVSDSVLGTVDSGSPVRRQQVATYADTARRMISESSLRENGAINYLFDLLKGGYLTAEELLSAAESIGLQDADFEDYLPDAVPPRHTPTGQGTRQGGFMAAVK